LQRDPRPNTTAAVIAALSLHGIILGPTIDIEHPGLLYFVYGGLIVANIAMYPWAFALIKPSVKLFSLPRELLLPMITLLCVIGSFAEKMAMFGRQVPRKPRLVGGSRGTNKNEISFPGSPPLWAGSFTFT
jgi:TctA family transporter